MKFLLITAATLFAVVVVASVISAYSTITDVICDGFDCKQNCKPLISFPLGKCMQNPGNTSQSAIFQCIPAPAGQMCFTQTIYNSSLPGGMSCSPSTTTAEYSQRCNVCNTDPSSQYPNSSSIALCAGDTITMKTSCDTTCTTCQSSEKYIVKQCFKYGGMMVSAPFSCNVELKVMMWNNASSCGGAAPRRHVMAAGLCNGYIDQTTGKPVSQTSKCS